jgi:hypothetical protein
LKKENPFLQEGKADNSVLDDLAENYQVEKSVDSEKKTRKPRAKKSERTTEDIESEKNFSDVAVFNAHIGLNLLIARMHKPIPLSDIEIESFDKAFTELAKKYYASVQRFGAEINFLIAATFIILPRIDFEKLKQERLKNGKSNIANIREDRNGKNHVSEVDVEAGKPVSDSGLPS